MRALLVIDVQKGIVNLQDFTKELHVIEEVIKDFKEKEDPVLFIQHFDQHEESPLHPESEGSQLYPGLKDYADYIVQKETPSAFYKTNLESILKELQVDQLFITGFNTEYCCLFTAIAGYDRGYNVTFLEEATGTVNTGETYEMNDLDIRDFIGTILHWSETMEVLDYEEYVEQYK
ncbi:isochorismatase family cysteine hydrolase [Ornithinibacillus sp. FSL M8-0202]|uniref:cysteine hydrolase family protein n=1 Tax=unclassified Ornithinibacillus TaxID=2620869 RepID=UPI0030D11E48